MSQRVWNTLSLTITVPCFSQSWVTRKMTSGAQSRHGYQGHHGQMRRCSSSGDAGSLLNRPSRRCSILAPTAGVSDLLVLTPVLASSSSKIASVGWWPTDGFSRMSGARLMTGEILSASSGLNSQMRCRHHHHGHQPQHQRNRNSKAPLASV